MVSTRPLAFDALKLALGHACSATTLRHEVRTLRHESWRRAWAHAMSLGRARPCARCWSWYQRLRAPSEATVLVTGESGTGKGGSQTYPRQQQPPFRPLCGRKLCGAYRNPAGIGTVRGHERGAFAGAEKRREGRFLAADKGTIFLDEIGGSFVHAGKAVARHSGAQRLYLGR